MNGSIYPFNGETRIPIPVETVCNAAKELDDVLVLGWKGDEFYMNCSHAEISEALLKVELARKLLIDQFTA